MPGYTLRTLGRLELVGPDGPCRVDDPIALPLLVLAALAPGGGIDEDGAMLRLTPDLTPTAARARLSAAAAAVLASAGAPIVEYAEGRLTLRRDLIAADVETAAVAESNPVQAGFLTGLAAPSPEFAEWVTDVRPRVRATRPMASPGSWLGTPSGRTAGLIALGGVVLMVAVWATRSAPPRGLAPGDAIVLADLDNATGDTLFDQSLTVAAAVGLRQSARFSLLPRNRVTSALFRMGRAGSDTVRLTLDLAREVAARENIRYALGLRIERAGEGFRLSVVLVDAVSGLAVRSAKANAETRAGTVAALDRLVDEARAGLGEGRGERRRSLGIPAATTPSLEALRAYAQGAAAWSSGQYQVARELWERSLVLDTGFAMAKGALGGYFALHMDRPQAVRFYTEALRQKSRLTEWEQLHLEERFAALRGLTDSSFVIHRAIVARFPSAASWYDYGADLVRRGKSAEAIAALTQSLQFDSSFSNVHVDLALSLKAVGRYDLALGHYQQAAAIDSTALLRGFTIAEYGELLVRLGRFEDAERHFRRVFDRSSIRDRPDALRSLGLLNVWRGRLDEGVGLLRQATATSIQIDDPTAIGALRGRSFEGMTLLLLGDRGQANRAFDSLMAHVGLTVEPRALALVARGLLRANRIADARRVGSFVRDTLGPDDRHAVDFIAAAVEIAEGRPDSGMALFAGGAAAPQPAVTGWVRVEGLVGQRKTRQALTLADSLLRNPDFGNESQLEWLSGLVTTADLAAELGERKAALAGYQRLIDLWAGGDRSSALLDHAKKQVEVLRTAR